MSDEASATQEAPASTGITGDAGTLPESSQDNGGQQQQPPASPPESKLFSFYGEEGPNAEIVSALPKPLQSLVNKYKNDNDLGKGIDHLNFMASSKGFEPLPPDADENMKARHNEIMRNVNRVPETVEGYKVERPESYTEDEWNQSGMGKYLETLHKHNASPELVNELIGVAGESMGAAKKAMETQAEEFRRAQIDAAQEKYGNQTEKMFQSANQVANTFGLPLEQIQTVEMVEFLNQVKNALSEDKLTQSEGVLDDSGNYDAQADSIMNDPSNPYYADYNSDDRNRQKRAQDEIIRLRNLGIKAKKGGQ